jgi:hypothetical protein
MISVGAMTKFLPRLALAFAVAALLAPVAHVLELPNKLRLDGALWLAVQQNLYRGWGPVLGAPTELGALALSLILCAERGAQRWRLLGAGTYAAMIVVFFIFNAPVNAVVAGWTAATLPPDWQAFRLRWEAGHLLSAVLAGIGLAATIRAGRGD